MMCVLKLKKKKVIRVDVNEYVMEVNKTAMHIWFKSNQFVTQLHNRIWSSKQLKSDVSTH